MIRPNLKNIITANTLLWVLNRSAFTYRQNFTAGSRENALGGAATFLPRLFTTFQNRALLAAIRFGTIAICNSQSYLFREFSEKATALILPAPPSNFVITPRQSGIPGYSENYYGVYLAISIRKMPTAGMQFNYYESLGFIAPVSLIVNFRK